MATKYQPIQKSTGKPVGAPLTEKQKEAHQEDVNTRGKYRYEALPDKNPKPPESVKKTLEKTGDKE
ncbi:hypothetical protein [Lewinella sp. W8]|uniref:hypothetical protein n=1 Tax=Lewinella sp. W8 TaxID=2528208 RepID=UPI0010675B33|nr:hypothetical protein [Lewinella sp. W8]MTB53035.1 hypothetical protein [Lewinella sp. W8]